MAAGVRKLDVFGTTPGGKQVDRWEIDNGAGLRAQVLNLGGIVTRLNTPDRNGLSENVLLSPRDVGTIFSPGWGYLNSIVGRFANRIAYGKFSLDGVTYSLATNGGSHTLHGGRVGYDRRIWDVTPVQADDGPALRLSLVDPDGTENFPGTVNVTVTYTLTKEGAWRIDYEATSDRATPINLTQHAYFNLKDAGRSSVLDHVVHLDATHYTPGDATLIPTGEREPVAGTVFDFTTPKTIRRDLSKLTNTPQGFDNNFVVPGEPGTLRQCARVTEPTTGRVMTVWTTEPGVQLYTGNFLNGTVIGADGFAFAQHSALCLETQHFPDSPNQPRFPSSILRPDQTYRQRTEYRFGTDR